MKCDRWDNEYDYKGEPYGDLDDLHVLLGKVARHYGHRMCMIKSQNRVLTLLDYANELPQDKIEKILVIKPSTACGVMKMLEEKGFVERDKSDLENITVKITDAGRDRVREIESGKIENEMPFAALTEEEQETLKPILLKMLKSWNPNADWDK